VSGANVGSIAGNRAYVISLSMIAYKLKPLHFLFMRTTVHQNAEPVGPGALRFETLHSFPGIQPNSDQGDYSRLSCGPPDTRLGPVLTPHGRPAQKLVIDLRRRGDARIAAISANPQMVRGRQRAAKPCSLCSGLSAQRERVCDHDSEPVRLAPLTPPALMGLRGFGWWRRAVALSSGYHSSA
jgi:hypothetical protein